MYAQSSKGLGSSLTEANVAQLVGFSDLEDMAYRIWDVVPCEIVNANDGAQYRRDI